LDKKPGAWSYGIGGVVQYIIAKSTLAVLKKIF